MKDRLKSRTIILCLCTVLVATTYSYALETRGNPTSSRVQKAQNATANTRSQKQSNFDATCGTLDDLAKRVEVCAKPLMDIIQGTVDKWPRTDEDAMKLCDSFSVSERCIRDTSRKCGKGIQKTIISTLAHSIGRARKRECGKTKAAAITKTTMCVERHQDIVHEWMSNVTGRLSAIELQTREGDRKINNVCCMVHDIEVEIKTILGPLCPTESDLITRLYRAVLEDVIELVCRNPKCKDYLKTYKISKQENFSGIISILLRIVFSLDSE